jgi:hypothetical protein
MTLDITSGVLQAWLPASLNLVPRHESRVIREETYDDLGLIVLGNATPVPSAGTVDALGGSQVNSPSYPYTQLNMSLTMLARTPDTPSHPITNWLFGVHFC